MNNAVVASGDVWSANGRPDRTTGGRADIGRSRLRRLVSSEEPGRRNPLSNSARATHWPEFGDGSGGKTVLEADASVLPVWVGA
jgi:hypothetical protein